ncbi:hypothetical protein mflW37_3220 [Mesoplasma florum W37]|uniref:Uncharacterized protein n=1 Tax=Mesoplasma florum TaxID=2151 RepID=A0AAD0HT13_MESFO|nr:hypothetical protein [Mesoplasma florum]AGY41389.1 hypothetical protein mflW37_3220 [Mesoplasma florum W37]AVN59611.1 hypothetical protein CG008_01680 [Mesoplasma florum]AVN65729.1 hypothetical protein MflW12_3240 [Mesoplasma florum]
MSNRMNDKIKMSEQEIKYRDLKIQKYVIKDILQKVVKTGFDKTNLYFVSQDGEAREAYKFVMFTKQWVSSIIKDVELLPIKEKYKIKAIKKLIKLENFEIVKEKRLKTYEIDQKYLDLVIQKLLSKNKLIAIRKLKKKLFILTDNRKKQYTNNLNVLNTINFKTVEDQKKMYQNLWDKEVKEYLNEREIALTRLKDPKRYNFLNDYYKKDPKNTLLKDFKPDKERYDIFKSIIKGEINV